MSIQAFIDEVSRRLRDDNPDRDCRQWDEGFLLNALNAAFGALCHVKPDAFTEFRDITLVDGHEQEIDADLHRIIEILHNVCRESGQPRRAITKADRGVFDASHPHWRQDASRGYIRHYMRNSITQSKFDVWPPAIAGDIVRGEFTKTPCVVSPDVETPPEGSILITDEVPFDKAYHLPLAEFCLYYAYAVDDDVTANSGRAQRHWLAFFQLMNKREDADLIVEQTQENSE